MKKLRLLLTFGSLLMAPALAAQSADEIAVAKATLSALQSLSFDNNREYCGYLGYDAQESLIATPATRGAQDECAYEGPEDGYVLVLSYHTHGRFSTDFAAEVPSVTDIEADEDEGIDGFVSTPGGRLWYVDTTDMIVRQICGLGCLPQDPRFIEGDAGPIEESYTYQELMLYESE